MCTHKIGTTRHVPLNHSVHDRQVLTTPFPYPSPIREAPKLQQAPQAVLLLDCLSQEGITAELSQHEILGDRFTVRANHRFRLNPRILGLLNDTGMTVCAKDSSGHIADAIEARDHPVYIGMQGRREVSSVGGRARPFLCAFLETTFRLRKR